MMKTYFMSILILVFLTSCSETQQPKETATEAQLEWTIQAIDFVEISDSTSVSSDDTAVHTQTEGWTEYKIDIPAAGRYKVSVRGESINGGSIWLEDYVHNKDDRTYNVTGQISLDSAMSNHVIVGSPFNKGPHDMRLHMKGNVSIESFSFELVKHHQLTPEVLTQNMKGDEWEVVWSDEFDTDGLPDSTKWTYDIGNWGWGNGELQYYTEGRKENARCENGNLIIEARKDDMGQPWTSARLTTRGKTSFVYGKIEFRAKVPSNKGNWAAGWTLGDKYVDELSWPYCGEIDILESVGYEMNDSTGNGKAHASAHCGAYYFKLGNQPTGIIEVESMEKDFHTYAVEWSSSGMTATVDDIPYFSYADTSSAMSWPFSDPQNLILNLTMGGGWGGQKGMDSTVVSQKYIVDYVRVYQKK
jgi:beta-glucanase (GH16 family)